MGIRESLQKSQKPAVVLAALVLVGSVVAIIVQAKNFGPAGPGDAYFTTDDGKTFFADDGKKRAPFDVGGKQAVRAHVFECGGKRVVGYMSRYTQDALATLEEAKQAQAENRRPADIGKLSSIAFTGTEYKKPGSDKWVRASDRTVGSIRIFKCPDGSAPSERTPE